MNRFSARARLDVNLAGGGVDSFDGSNGFRRNLYRERNPSSKDGGGGGGFFVCTSVFLDKPAEKWSLRRGELGDGGAVRSCLPARVCVYFFGRMFEDWEECAGLGLGFCESWLLCALQFLSCLLEVELFSLCALHIGI